MHQPLNGSARLEQPTSDGRTLSEQLDAPARMNPAAAAEHRGDLRALAERLPLRLTQTEATVFARVLNGATLAEVGEGVGRGSVYGGPAKTADRALARLRRKA